MRTMKRFARVEGVLVLAVAALAVSALLAGCGDAAPEDDADDEQQAPEVQETVERTVPTRLSEQDSDFSVRPLNFTAKASKCFLDSGYHPLN